MKERRHTLAHTTTLFLLNNRLNSLKYLHVHVCVCLSMCVHIYMYMYTGVESIQWCSGCWSIPLIPATLTYSIDQMQVIMHTRLSAETNSLHAELCKSLSPGLNRSYNKFTCRATCNYTGLSPAKHIKWSSSLDNFFTC